MKLPDGRLGDLAAPCQPQSSSSIPEDAWGILPITSFAGTTTHGPRGSPDLIG